MQETEVRFAVVREVPESFDRCLKNPHLSDQVIDLDLARAQHAAYCDALVAAGLDLIRLPADDRYPDCCFVEDSAVIAGQIAVILNMGASSRVGEEAAVREALSAHKTIVELEPPATVDGGDVLRIGKRMFVGQTERTSGTGIARLQELVTPGGYEVIPVPVGQVLHLKSSCSTLPDGSVLIVPDHFPPETFARYSRVTVAAGEEYCANCLRVNDQVLFSQGFEHTLARVAALGVKVHEVGMSEFRKANGSLTCLSILF